MSDPVVRLTGVQFAYDARRIVLDGCDLELRSGERVGLLGPNGSGKSTLLAILVGLARCQRGAVEIFGKPRATESDFQAIRGPVGLLFQDADDQLFCPTVLEDVAFGPLNLGVPRADVRRLVAQTLAKLGLSGYEDRVAHQLSVGEKRMVALAAVLAMNPEVLLLDEPTAGLDASAAQRVTELLASLPQAMLVVSHDRAWLDGFVRRTLRLEGGRLIAVAP
jgi:cobalt/nickel transport system ATP-binding protein